MAYSPHGLESQASEVLNKTEIIASAQHPMEGLVEPYPINHEDRPFGYQSSLELLQKGLQNEAQNGWKLVCLPRLYSTKPKSEENGDTAMSEDNKPISKHVFPSFTIASPVNPGPSPTFPETYFSLYSDQGLETVPRADNIAASIIRDAIVDTINILDFNRNIVAKFLIELDCFFTPGTFLKRGTQFDRIREIPEGESTWKPEDMIVDGIFAQMLLLPSAEHKLVYYHSVITEACRLAPGAIAPTLGRAIRFLYRSNEFMDLELSYRFLDWFAHHLSNFDFRWKWIEWYVLHMPNECMTNNYAGSMTLIRLQSIPERLSSLRPLKKRFV
jgi:nuclear cap-binding protein subunit 1